MTRYALIAALLASLGLSGAVIWLQRSNASLAAENARLERSIAALEKQAESAKVARDVEAARAKAAKERADSLQADIETIFRSFEDAPLSPDLADLVNSLRGD